MDNIILNNGVVLPKQGLGTFSYTENLDDIVQYAKDAGINLYDTSDDYHNEILLGQALRKAYVQRTDYKVITKFTMPTHPHEVEFLFRDSLKKLFGTEDAYVDVLLIHWPYPNVFPSIWKEMEKLYEKGLCKSIGVCNFNINHLEMLKKKANIIPAINQIEIHPLFAQHEICKYCAENGIQIMSYSPLARMNKALIENEILLDLANKYQKTVVQIILRWNYQKNYIAIPAGSSQEHIKNNASIKDFMLTDEEIQIIDALDCGMRVRLNPETFFSSKDKLKFQLADIYYHCAKIFK